MTKISAKQKILQSAHDLFYQDGIRATGINKIISAAQVTKVTFYRHFSSKDVLIVAFLEYRHQNWMEWFSDALARHGAYSDKSILALVPVLAEWFNKPIFRGCAFINSVAELGISDEVMTISRAHKEDVQGVIMGLLPESEGRHELANAIAIAVDGAIFKAQLAKPHETVDVALRGLELLLVSLQNDCNSA